MKPIHSVEFSDWPCRSNAIVAWLCAALLLCAVTTSSIAAVSKDLLVASFTTGTVTRLDGVTGATVYSVPQGTSTINMAQGPDGAVYVSTLFTSSVTRVDFETGAPLGAFASGGGLATAVGVAFGPDGNLYVGSRNTNSVLRYDGLTGAFMGPFVAPASGGLTSTEGLLFGPDGNLYVTEFNGTRVLRYNGVTGAFIDVFATNPNLNGARGLAFGPDGHLYVAGNVSDNVVRFHGATGAFLNVFALGIDGANGLAFGEDGQLYVGSEVANRIMRFNGTSGAFIDNFATVTGPVGILFVETFNARQIKRDAIETLIALLPSPEEKPLNSAIDHLETSLSADLWIDNSHLTEQGQQVFDGERKAVRELGKMTLNGATVTAVINVLVEVDARLAEIAIAEANDANGAKQHLRSAQRHYRMGTKFQQAGKFEQAIQGYRAAWIATQHATK